MTVASRLSIFCILGAAALTSCGGGGGSDSSTPVTVTPPAVTQPPVVTTPPANGAPIALASSSISTITGGGQFTVTATESSDPDGDSLTFTWVQTGGPSILPGGTIQTPNLTLTSPDVTQDTALTFQLTASDGTSSATDTVTVTAQPLSAPVTVRPVAPINTDTALLNGITNEGTDQYRIYWADGFSTTANNIIASQIFSDDGAPVGSQINGSFELPQLGSTTSTQINGLFPLSVVENGGITYAPLIYVFENAVDALGSLVGPFEGNLSPVDAPFISLTEGANITQAPIGTDSLLNAVTLNSSIDASVQVNIFNPNGDVETVTSPFQESAPAGDPFATVGSLSSPAVTAIGDGGYIVAWRREEERSFEGPRTIDAQIYTSNNTLSGGTLSVDPSAGPDFSAASQLDAATFGDGSVLLVWIESQDVVVSNEANNGDFTDFIVRGRIVSPDGTFATDEFTVHENENTHFTTVALTLSNGDVLVTWGEFDGGGIRGRIISSNGPLTLGPVFDLAPDVVSAGYPLLQTQTGRVILGYNFVGDDAISSEVVSFCPVGCQ